MDDTRSQHQISRVKEGPIPHFEYCPALGDPPIIYQDEHIIVVDKPAGLLSVPGIAPEKHDCVRSRVQGMIPDAVGPMTCHRLDLSTSGVMVLGLTKEIHRNLSIQFENRRTHKRYLALLDGHLSSDEGTINCPMRKDMDVRPLQLVDYVQGKPSVTHYRVIARETLFDRPATRVELIPHTGRTHQLRVHAAHPKVTTIGRPSGDETMGLGMPIIGDELYDQRGESDRLMLHASMLTIHHPVTGKQVTFYAPDPF